VVKDIAGKLIDSFKLADCATPCGGPAAAPVAAAQIALAPLTLSDGRDGGVKDSGP